MPNPVCDKYGAPGQLCFRSRPASVGLYGNLRYSMRVFLAASTSGRFLVAGVVAAIFYFSANYVFLWAGIPGFLAGAMAYICAIVLGFSLQHFWTFRNRTRVLHSLPRYLMVQVLCILLSGGAVHTAVTVFGAKPFLASLCATIALSALSFVTSTRWVFKNA